MATIRFIREDLEVQCNPGENLRELVIEGWGIKELPENIGNLQALEKLTIVGHNVKEIPISIFNLSGLKYLEFKKIDTKTVFFGQLVAIFLNISLMFFFKFRYQKNLMGSTNFLK